MKPPKVLLLCGPPASGKTFITERHLGPQYDVATSQIDAAYKRALGEVGIPPTHGVVYSISLVAAELRSDGFDRGTVGQLYAFLHAEIVEHIRRAQRWGVVALFEGYTLRYPDEAATIASAAYAAGDGQATVDRVQLKPTLEDWQRNREEQARRYERVGVTVGRGDLSVDVLYERQMKGPEPVLGVTDHVVSGLDELRELADRIGVRAHPWYQRFTLGPVSTDGVSDADEKVNTVHSDDIVGRSVVDLCCCTGAHAFMMKDRGAAKVVGIEKSAARFCKCLELQKTLRRYSRIDADVEFRLGDVTKELPALQAFDTVVIFGAIHYFADYQAFLASLGRVAQRAVYVEFTFSEKEHDTAESPGEIRAYRRATTGATIYMGDRDAVERAIGDAMSDFRIQERMPISAPGSNLKSDREVWRMTRVTQGTATT